MISVCNCGNCKWRDDSCVLASMPPKYYCRNKYSGKQYVEMGDYCDKWEEKKTNWDTTTSDYTSTDYLIKETLNVLLKITERVQKLEDSVGLSEKVAILGRRTEDKVEAPKDYHEEKWLVHRTLRKSGGRETYVSLDRNGYRLRNYDTPFNHYELYSHTDRKQAKEFSREEAIHIRDILNEKRVGKRYLWVISKLEA